MGVLPRCQSLPSDPPLSKDSLMLFTPGDDDGSKGWRNCCSVEAITPKKSPPPPPPPPHPLVLLKLNNPIVPVLAKRSGYDCSWAKAGCGEDDGSSGWNMFPMRHS